MTVGFERVDDQVGDESRLFVLGEETCAWNRDQVDLWVGT